MTVVVRERHHDAIEPVRDRTAGWTRGRELRPEHKVVDEEFASALERGPPEKRSPGLSRIDIPC